MSELKKCPFCGSEANIVGGSEDWHPTSYDPDSGGDPYSIVCSGCECGMALAFWDSDEAIAAWNRRVGPDIGNPITEKLTCRGCIYFEDDHEFNPCQGCKRLVRVNDYYRQKPEGGEG